VGGYCHWEASRKTNVSQIKLSVRLRGSLNLWGRAEFEGEQVEPIEAPTKDTVPQEAALGSSAPAVKRKYVADEKDKEFCKKVSEKVQNDIVDCFA
jgi:hypothetical protein